MGTRTVVRIGIGLFVVASLVVAFFPWGSRKSDPTFSLDGSNIRFETTKFESKDILAEANGIKLTFSQILDKSPVMKDLAQQEADALIGLVYLRAVDKAGAKGFAPAEAKAETPTKLPGRGQKPAATVTHSQVEIYLPKTDTPLERILVKFDRKPLPGIGITFAKSDDDRLLGKYQSQTVSKDEIDPNHGVLQSIEKRRYQETASQLNSQLARVLINEEAIKIKKPIQEYINEKILGGKPVEISDGELKAHLAKIGFAESELNPQLKNQFEQSLRQRKEQKLLEDYVAKNIIKGSVKVAFRAPHADFKLNEEWKPLVGTSDAPISIVAFGGSTCPDCPAFIKTVYDMTKKYNGHVRLNWIHFFRENDGLARMLAEGALCVESQKQGQSLAFMNHFAETVGKIDETAFYEWAKANKLDDGALKACFLERKSEPLLTQHLALTRKIGIMANPTIWIDGAIIEGVVRPEEVDRLVRERIAATGSTWYAALVRRLKSRT